MSETCNAFDTAQAGDTHQPRSRRNAARARGARNGCVAQLFVFEGDDYLGWDCFEKDTVFIGGGPEVDLELADPNLNGMQAVIHFDGQRVVVHDPHGLGRVRVNDEPVQTRVLGSLDVVGIGRYSLKVRIKRIRREPDPISGRPQPQRTGRTRPVPQHRPAPQHHDIPDTPHAALSGHLPQGDGTRTPHIVGGEAVSPAVIIVEPVRRQTPAVNRLPARVQPIDEPVPADEAHRLSSDPTSLPAEVIEHAPLWDELDGAETLQLFEVLVDEVICDDAQTAPGATLQPEASRADAESGELGELGAEIVDLDQRRAAEPNFSGRATVPSGVSREDDEEDEEDEPDLAANFTLADRLFAAGPETDPEAGAVPVVEVVRFHAQQVADVRFLQPGESCCRATRDGEIPIVRHHRDGTCRFTFDREHLFGTLTDATGEQTHTDALCSPENRVGRKSDRFRQVLAADARAALTAGYDTYLVRWTLQVPGPPVTEVAAPGRPALKNLLASGLLHLLLLAAGGLFLSLPNPTDPPPPESRFIQIDTRQLDSLVQPRPKPKPRPKAEPVRPIQNKQPPPPPKVAKAAKPKPAPAAQPTQPTAPDSVARAGDPGATRSTGGSAHPDAGGGHGGNALNRNIKQEGILGALGIADGIGVGAKQAMAAVTNLDAVSTAHASEGALKVGGIVGKLGSSKIALPKVGLVNTKGTSQVVASAGVGGAGTVAALARGETGQGQVMGLVSADLKAPVRIQGGMTREEVKTVIDRHMDEITYCYETALIDDPSLVGKMAFEWRILESGAVGEVRIQASTIRSDPLHSCIKRAIKTWSFPQPRGGADVLVSYPFIFDVVGF